MTEWLVKILVLGVAVWIGWSLLQTRYVFEIRVRSGQPHVRRGKVTAAFLGRVTAVCRDSGVAWGWVGGVQRGRRVALRFSRHFPPGAQQRLRNEWMLAS